LIIINRLVDFSQKKNVKARAYFPFLHIHASGVHRIAFFADSIVVKARAYFHWINIFTYRQSNTKLLLLLLDTSLRQSFHRMSLYVRQCHERYTLRSVKEKFILSKSNLVIRGIGINYFLDINYSQIFIYVNKNVKARLIFIGSIYADMVNPILSFFLLDPALRQDLSSKLF
jgi:hypothetical protein